MDLKWLTPMQDYEFDSFLRTIMPVNNMAGYLRRLMDLLDESLAAALREHENRPETPLEESDWEYQHYYEETELETRIELGSTYPAITWSAVLISIYSLLEHELLSIVRHMAKVKGVDKDPEEKKGIFGAQEFLRKHFDMDPSLHIRWPELLLMNKFRNCLAHDRGHLGTKEVEVPFEKRKNFDRDLAIRQHAGQHPDLFYLNNDDNEVQVSSAYCRQSLDAVEKFLNRVIDEGRLWLVRWDEECVVREGAPKVSYLKTRVPFKGERLR